MCDYALELSTDDYVQDFFCEYLEYSVDKQDHLIWSQRDWDSDKLRSYMACCFALPFFVKNDLKVLARMLRCFCDAESGGVQVSLISACESFCPNPYDNEDFIREIVKASPEMLKKSPKWFADYFFPGVYVPDKPSRLFFYEAFTSLEKKEQQVIIDFMQYDLERNPEKEDLEYHQTRLKVMTECLRLSGLQEGNSLFFFMTIDGCTCTNDISNGRIRKCPCPEDIFNKCYLLIKENGKCLFHCPKNISNPENDEL